MNWNRAKTILIFLFLFTDLFLLANMLSTYKSATISTEIIKSTAEILNANNIKIDVSAIPNKSLPAPYAEAENVISDYDSFSVAFLGDNAAKTGDYSYESKTGAISFSGDSFNYKAAAFSISSDADEKNAQETAIRFLKDKGFDLSSAKIETSKISSGFLITFENYANSLPVFNSHVSVEISGNSVSAAYGIWFNALDTRGQDNELKSVTSALIDFIPEAGGEAIEISGLELGYTVPESTSYHKSAVLVPVWRISEASGRQHFPDARTPE
ncbi:MAG: two-component system regulatory protein YycI [Clostridia bacterium]|nr:two-component system regulatory protein YycI [Clostridia bacterium]